MIDFIRDFIESVKEGADEGSVYVCQKYPEILDIFVTPETYAKFVKIVYGSLFGLSTFAIIMIIALGVKGAIKLFKRKA